MTQTTPTPSALTSRPHTTDNGSGRRTPRPGWLLAVVLTGQLMAVIDAFIVNVAAPTLRADLHASGAELQLVIAGYTIAYAVLLITGARLGARIGHRTAFLSGLAVFTLTSLACGLAANTGQLITFRFVQGAGAALMMPQVLSLIQRTFTGSSRGRALGMYSAVLAGGAASGQIIGGVLVDADLFGTGWRPAFLVNVPIGLALLAIGPRLLPRDHREESEHTRGFDLPGLVLLAGAVLLFTVPLVLGQERGWPLWCWAALALSAVLGTLFAVYEARLARRGGSPLLSPRVVRAPGIGVAVVRLVTAMAGNAGLLFVVALHVQGVLGFSALHAGVLFVPCAVMFGAIGLNWQRLPARWQRVMVPTGFAAAAAGFLGTGLALRDGSDGGGWIYLAMALVGGGLGSAYSPSLTRALAAVRQEDAADASGVLVTAAQLGLLLGVAIFGAVYLGDLDPSLTGTGPSADAVWTTSLTLTGAALVGAAAGLLRHRR